MKTIRVTVSHVVIRGRVVTFAPPLVYDSECADHATESDAQLAADALVRKCIAQAYAGGWADADDPRPDVNLRTPTEAVDVAGPIADPGSEAQKAGGG